MQSIKGKKASSSKKAAAKKSPKSEGPTPGFTVGLESGLGVTDTWNKYLKANGKAKQSERKTDDDLAKAIAKEFPKREKVQPVGRVRSWYNNGRYGFGLNGKKMPLADRSVAYDDDGNVMSRRAGGFGKKATAKKAVVKKAKPKVAARKRATVKKAEATESAAA